MASADSTSGTAAENIGTGNICAGRTQLEAKHFFWRLTSKNPPSHILFSTALSFIKKIINFDWLTGVTEDLDDFLH